MVASGRCSLATIVTACHSPHLRLHCFTRRICAHTSSRTSTPQYLQPRFPRRPGISKAFQTALLGRDDTVIQTLVSYNAKAERVSLRKLVDSLRKTTSHGDGTGDKVHVWGASFTWSGIRGARLQRLTDLYASSHLMRSRVNPGGALLRMRGDSGGGGGGGGAALPAA